MFLAIDTEPDATAGVDLNDYATLTMTLSVSL